MALEKIQGQNNRIPRAGVGYVIVPEGVDSQEYIDRCYRTHSISINGGFGCGDFHNVKITDTALQHIHFPQDEENKGSAVVWIRDSFWNKPIVLDAIESTGEVGNQSYKRQRMFQETLSRVAEVFLDALNANVNITALGDERTAGKITIKASSERLKGDLIDIESGDVINIGGRLLRVRLEEGVDLVIGNGLEDYIRINMSEGGYKFSDIFKNEFTLNKDGLLFKDQFENTLTIDKEKTDFKDQFENEVTMNADEIHVKDCHSNEAIMNDENVQILANKKFNIGNGNEPIVLGQTLVNTLGQLCDAISTITVPTPHGPSSTPINASQFSSIKANLKAILSQLSNTD